MTYDEPDAEPEGLRWLPPLIIIVLAVAALTVGYYVFMAPALHSSITSAGNEAARRIQAPSNAALGAAVQSDVSNAVTSVTTYLAQIPGGNPASAPTTTSDPRITLQISGTADNWQVTGVDTQSGYTYAYASATGQFTTINPGAAAPQQVQGANP